MVMEQSLLSSIALFPSLKENGLLSSEKAVPVSASKPGLEIKVVDILIREDKGRSEEHLATIHDR